MTIVAQQQSSYSTGKKNKDYKRIGNCETLKPGQNYIVFSYIFARGSKNRLA